MAEQTRSQQPQNLSLLMQILISIAVCFGAAALGGILTQPNLDWYATLETPGFTPPNSVFAPVWTLLFASMAASLFWVWRRAAREPDKRLAFRWFGAQLVLNVGWSFAFFQMHSPLSALFVSFALLIAIAVTIVVFDRIARGPALLLVPYLLWVCFATALTFAIWSLNG